MTRWKHDPFSPWLSEGHAEQIAAVEAEQMPERAEYIERLNEESTDRIRAAICRPSGPRAQREATAVIRRAGGRVLRPIKREGVA